MSKSKEKIPATVKNSVWLTYIGKQYDSKCFCCNLEQISKGNFECGHITSEKTGGQITIDNLRPTCSPCNKSMGIKNMEEFMKKHGYAKNKNWNGIVNKNDNINNSPLHIFLNKLPNKKLQQLCMIFDISPHGTKDKLVNKIINNGYTLTEIQNKINENKDKKYLIKCDGNETKSCGKCQIIGKDIILQCDDCNSAHIYYTNNKLSNDKHLMINNHRKIRPEDNKECDVCKKNCYMEEHENQFYE